MFIIITENIWMAKCHNVYTIEVYSFIYGTALLKIKTYSN